MGEPIHRLIEQGPSPSLTQIASRSPRNDGARKIEHHSHFEISPPRGGQGSPPRPAARNDPLSPSGWAKSVPSLSDPALWERRAGEATLQACAAVLAPTSPQAANSAQPSGYDKPPTLWFSSAAHILVALAFPGSNWIR